MGLLFIFVLAISGDRVVEARFTERPPRIDGIIEEIWQVADSAYDFVQFSPYERETPTERTVVYVLQDRENLYFAFRCHAEKRRPIACLTADEDHIIVGLDPFDSRTTSYYFIVYASRIINDGWVLDDGRTIDDSWDGVWYRAVKLYDDRYDVELKIPFKSIRYKKGLDRWGLQLKRYSAGNRETDYWTDVLQVEEYMVSKYGKLTGVNPEVTGHYFELYPEGFVRYDTYEAGSDELRARLSLNLKWDLTPETSLSATAYPDFAQIESDPFILNLSRYPTYLAERRPFFVEGKEIFRMSDFGEDKGFFKALNMFYSRRIGKSIDGEVVPILGGLKLTNRSEDWNVGLLGALTDEYCQDDSVLEPRRSFGVLRVERELFENSDVGMFLSGTRVDGDDHNYALGFDGVYRRGVNQVILQAAASERGRKRGWAITSGYSGFLGGFLTMGSAEMVHDSFDVSDVGFIPWVGRRKFTLFSGPFTTYTRGFLKNLYLAPGFAALKEPGDKSWSTLGQLIFNPEFRNNWGLSLEGQAGRVYEVDRDYLHRSVDLSVWGTIAGQFVNFGGDYSYEYNYWRQFLAHQASGRFRVGVSVTPEVSLSLNSNVWAEWDTLSAIIGFTGVTTPRVDCRVNADMSLSLFNEFVLEIPEIHLEAAELTSSRFGLLFSWNFLPKSWLYVALNDYRDRWNGEFRLRNRIGAVKAKYLMYF